MTLFYKFTEYFHDSSRLGINWSLRSESGIIYRFVMTILLCQLLIELLTVNVVSQIFRIISRYIFLLRFNFYRICLIYIVTELYALEHIIAIFYFGNNPMN